MKKCNTIEAFMKCIPDELSELDLLSLYLQHSESNPRELSQQLLSCYGNLANLIDTDPDHIRLYHGTSDKTNALLQLLTEFRRRYLMIRARTDVYLRDNDAIRRYLMPLFSGEVKEVAYLLCLDEEYKVLGCKRLSQGDLTSVNVSTRVLAHEALLHKASIIVIAHNHPSGQALPSHTDVNTSFSTQSNLAALGITVLDHYIFANDNGQGISEANPIGFRNFHYKPSVRL
ncbi:MAG: JAB domain-containing protein [Oscillospiraceae bacterium]|nr:JAB domain-containing protein [Oscillospiraceae bacterium]